MEVWKTAETLRDQLQISLLILTEFKGIPPELVKNPCVFWWFQGELKLTDLNSNNISGDEPLENSVKNIWNFQKIKMMSQEWMG